MSTAIQLNLLDPEDDGLPSMELFQCALTMEQFKAIGTRDSVRYLLEHYLDSRKDDRVLVFLYWWHVDGLKYILALDEGRRLLHFLLQPSTKQAGTIRRRRTEIHELRSGTGTLLPPDYVVQRRKERDGAGPPRGTDRTERKGR